MAQHVSDPLVAELIGVYDRGAQRLDATVRAGLARGLDPERIGTPAQRRGDATLAYRRRQREQALAIIGELRAQTTSSAPLVIGQAYRSGLVATDRSLGPGALRGEFGRVHVRAVEALAGNMTGALDAALARAGENIDLVFERADALDALLADPNSPQAPSRALRFLGRRQDDPYRRVALEEVTQGIVGLATRREVSANLAARLIREGVTDATTGFVDRAGRRWPLPKYAAMVARTTTREAMSAATVNRLVEAEQTYVTISTHSHLADECSPYDGQTFALPGQPNARGLRVLDNLPPFHPNCGHVVGPATVGLDDYEAELERAVAAQAQARRQAKAAQPAPGDAPSRPSAGAPSPEEAARAADPARQAAGDAAVEAAALSARGPHGELRAPITRLVEDPATPPRPPFGDEPRPKYRADTEDAHEAQRVAEFIAGDPGPEPGAWEAEFRDVQRDERRAVAALKVALGDDLGTYVLGGRGTRPKAFAVKQNLKARMLSGELSVDDVVDLVTEHEEEVYNEAQERALRRRPKVRPCPCFSCGRFKPRASSICDHCGDDPIVLEDASDYQQMGYSENADGSSSWEEGSAIQRARRQLDIDVYGLDPDDPNADPRGPAASPDKAAVDAYSASARRRRAIMKARPSSGRVRR